MIFATDNNLKLLAEAETVFVDGAFHTYPEIFKSDLSTVHAFKNGQQFSLAYCLLPDKTWQFLPADLYPPKGEGRRTMCVCTYQSVIMVYLD